MYIIIAINKVKLANPIIIYDNLIYPGGVDSNYPATKGKINWLKLNMERTIPTANDRSYYGIISDIVGHFTPDTRL